VRKITIQVTGSNGQLIHKKEAVYQDGEVDMSRLPSGLYVLHIVSGDGKYRHVQKIIKR
jgi:hypothetical protein